MSTDHVTQKVKKPFFIIHPLMTVATSTTSTSLSVRREAGEAVQPTWQHIFSFKTAFQETYG